MQAYTDGVPLFFCPYYGYVFPICIIPGSPFQRGGVSESVVEAIEQEYGLNEPLFTQYISYIGGVLHGDLGISYQDPAVRVTEVIARAWPVTASVGTAALIVSLIMGTGLGILSAVSGRRSVKQVISAGGMIAAGIPGFAAAILLMLVFSVKLKLLPASGLLSPIHYILPVAALAVSVGHGLAAGQQYAGDGAYERLCAVCQGQRTWQAAGHIYPCAEKCVSSGYQLYRPGVCIPVDGKLRGGEHFHHTRPGAGVRRIDHEPGLHAHPGTYGLYGCGGDPCKSYYGPAVRVAGSEDPEGISGGARINGKEGTSC